MNAGWTFAAGLVACAVGILQPDLRGVAILAAFACLLAGLYRLGD